MRIRDGGEAASDQVKERIGREILAYFGRNNGHGTPHREHITSFTSGGIFASLFTKGQCNERGNHWAWRLSGNCWVGYANGPAQRVLTQRSPEQEERFVALNLRPLAEQLGNTVLNL